MSLLSDNQEEYIEQVAESLINKVNINFLKGDDYREGYISGIKALLNKIY